MTNHQFQYANLPPLDLRAFTLGSWSDDQPLKPSQSLVKRRWVVAGAAAHKDAFVEKLLQRISRASYGSVKVFQGSTEVNVSGEQVGQGQEARLVLSDLETIAPSRCVRLLLCLEFPLHAGIDFCISIMGPDLIIRLSRWLVNGPLNCGPPAGCIFILLYLIGIPLMVVVFIASLGNVNLFDLVPDHRVKRHFLQLKRDSVWPFVDAHKCSASVKDWQKSKSIRSDFYASLSQQVLATLDEFGIHPKLVKEHND